MKLIRILICVVCLLVGTQAMAGEGYIGAGVGSMKIEDDSGLTGFSASTGDIKIFGGYQFNENFSFDLGYLSTLGAAEDDFQGLPIEIGLTGFVVRTTLYIPTSDKLSLLASIGYWDGEAEATIFDVSDTADASGLAYGVGFKYDFEKISLRGEWEGYDEDETTLWSLMVSIQIGFGA